MANGVNIVPGKGVELNFTRFTGQEMIETTKPYVENDFQGFPYTAESTVEGYITGMTSGNIIFK